MMKTISEGTRKDMQVQIEIIDKLLRGEEFDGLRIGSPGITREWLEEQRADLARIIVTGEFRR